MTDLAEKLTWTDHQIDTLKRLRAAGMSATGIAAQIGGSCSRNAVLGKIRRLGLAQSTKPAPVKSPKPKPKPLAPAVKTAAKPTLPPAPKPAPVAPPPVAVIPRETCFDPGTRPTIGLDDLRNGVCRWPFGDRPPLRYCGDPTAEPANPLVVYCRAHAALAYTATKARAA